MSINDTPWPGVIPWTLVGAFLKIGAVAELELELELKLDAEAIRDVGVAVADISMLLLLLLPLLLWLMLVIAPLEGVVSYEKDCAFLKVLFILLLQLLLLLLLLAGFGLFDSFNRCFGISCRYGPFKPLFNTQWANR